MCMLGSVVTKDFGLLGTDSAQYDMAQSKMSYQSKKLFFTSKYLFSFIGTAAYFAKLDKSKLDQDMNGISLYLTDYLKEMKPKVEEQLRAEIKDEDENKPNFCLFVLGVHNKKPTLAQFNSFNDFKAKYLFSENGPKFSTIMYGDDNPKKKQIFQESTEYMEKKTHKAIKKGMEITPGFLGEIITRGIYKKADLEQELIGKKYAGGVVNVGGVLNDGSLFTLSAVQGV